MDFETLKSVPEDMRAACKFCGYLGEAVFFAEHYTIDGGVLQLVRVIMDTSDRLSGVTLKEQWSFVELFAISPQYKWSIRSIGPEERP